MKFWDDPLAGYEKMEVQISMRLYLFLSISRHIFLWISIICRIASWEILKKCVFFVLIFTAIVKFFFYWNFRLSTFSWEYCKLKLYDIFFLRKGNGCIINYYIFHAFINIFFTIFHIFLHEDNSMLFRYIIVFVFLCCWFLSVSSSRNAVILTTTRLHKIT